MSNKRLNKFNGCNKKKKKQRFYQVFLKTTLFLFSECQDPLGMEDGAISDAQINTSSQWNANHAAKQGRLYFQEVQFKAGSWSAKVNNVSEWLQIDLGNQHTKVTRVATQGRNAHSQWVTKYRLQYSDDGFNFQYYRENDTIKVSETFLNITNIDYIFNSHDIRSTFIYKIKTLKPIELLYAKMCPP